MASTSLLVGLPQTPSTGLLNARMADRGRAAGSDRVGDAGAGRSASADRVAALSPRTASVVARMSPYSIKEYARQKARRALLGDETQSLRLALVEELNASPVRVHLKDKVAFTLGLINVILSVFLLVRYPQAFYIWYAVW